MDQSISESLLLNLSNISSLQLSILERISAIGLLLPDEYMMNSLMVLIISEYSLGERIMHANSLENTLVQKSRVFSQELQILEKFVHWFVKLESDTLTVDQCLPFSQTVLLHYHYIAINLCCSRQTTCILSAKSLHTT